MQLLIKCFISQGAFLERSWPYLFHGWLCLDIEVFWDEREWTRLRQEWIFFLQTFKIGKTTKKFLNLFLFPGEVWSFWSICSSNNSNFRSSRFDPIATHLLKGLANSFTFQLMSLHIALMLKHHEVLLAMGVIWWRTGKEAFEQSHFIKIIETFFLKVN